MDDEGQYVDEELLEENEFAEEAEEEDEEEEDRDEDEDESDDDGGNEDVIVPAVRFSVSEGGIRQRRRSSLRQSETRALRVAVGALFADDDFTDANDERALESRRMSRLSMMSTPYGDHHSEGSIAMRDIATDHEMGPDALHVNVLHEKGQYFDASQRQGEKTTTTTTTTTTKDSYDCQRGRRRNSSKGWQDAIRDGIDDVWKTSVSVYRHLIAQYELNTALLEGEDPEIRRQAVAAEKEEGGRKLTRLGWLQKLIANPVVDLLFHSAILVCLLLLLFQDDHTKSAWEVRESLEEVFVDDHEDSFKYISNVLPDSFDSSQTRSFWEWFDRRFTPALYPNKSDTEYGLIEVAPASYLYGNVRIMLSRRNKKQLCGGPDNMRSAASLSVSGHTCYKNKTDEFWAPPPAAFGQLKRWQWLEKSSFVPSIHGWTGSHTDARYVVDLPRIWSGDDSCVISGADASLPPGQVGVMATAPFYTWSSQQRRLVSPGPVYLPPHTGALADPFGVAAGAVNGTENANTTSTSNNNITGTISQDNFANGIMTCRYVHLSSFSSFFFVSLQSALAAPAYTHTHTQVHVHNAHVVVTTHSILIVISRCVSHFRQFGLTTVYAKSVYRVLVRAAVSCGTLAVADWARRASSRP